MDTLNFFKNKLLKNFSKTSQKLLKNFSTSQKVTDQLNLSYCLKSLFQHYQGSYRLSKKCSRTFQDFLSTKTYYFPGLMPEFHIVFHDHSDKEIHKTFRRKRYQAELILNLMQIFYKIQNNK